MKRWLRNGFICTYLTVLAYGIACHTLGFGIQQHTAMYFIVWDMFCGWGSYTSNSYVIAEGESGKFYELAPGPWGDLKPWGRLGRQHYDAFNNFTWRIGQNSLKHTRHEPMTRIFIVEECWSKKFDIPDHIWKQRYDEPKDVKKYCRIRTELAADGTVLRSYTPWVAYQGAQMLANNPRLQADSNRGRPMLMIETLQPGQQMSLNSGFEANETPSEASPVGSLYGN